MKLAIFISFIIGFCSLALEITWLKIMSFSFYGLPFVFALTLSLFLFGIAFGSKLGTFLLSFLAWRNKNELPLIMSILIYIGVLIDFSLLLLVYNIPNTIISIFFIAIAIFITAFSKAILFPFFHEYGSNEKKYSTSFVYAGNVLGGTIAPIITTFLIFEIFDLFDTFKIVFVLLIVLSMFIMKNCKLRLLYLITGILIFITPFNTKTFLSNISVFKHINNEKGEFDKIYENKYGFITLKDKTVYGNGIYDGKINTSIINNTNGIDRLYNLFSYHNDYKDILIMGLSTGSWTKAASKNKTIKIDVIDINKKYIDLINNSENKDILTNKNINIIIDDARKYLLKNNKKYDLIILNNSYYYKQNSSFLSSVEFFKLIKSRFKSNKSLMAINTTGSNNIVNTLSYVFKNAYLLRNFGVASESELTFNESNIKDFNHTKKELSLLKEKNKLIKKEYNKDISIITDNNPIIEFKEGFLKELYK